MSTIVSLQQIAAARAGRGTIVALHCSGSSAAQWRKLAEQTVGGCELRTPELYGCGNAGGWTGEGAFTLPDEGHRMVAAIDALRGPLHLVGHSYGGAVALHAAMRRPERVASLALYEPILFHLLPAMGAAGAEAHAEITALAAAIGHSVVSGDYRAAARRFVDYWSIPGTWHGLRPEIQAELVRWIVKAPLDFRAVLGDATPPAAYAQLACPVLILRGEHAPAPTRLIAERLAELFPSCRADVIPGAGHMGPITHAAAVNSAILDLVARAQAARQPRRLAV